MRRIMFAIVVAVFVFAAYSSSNAAICKFINNTGYLFNVTVVLVNSSTINVGIPPNSTKTVDTGTIDYTGFWYGSNFFTIPHDIVTVDITPIEAQMLLQKIDGVGFVTFNPTP